MTIEIFDKENFIHSEGQIESGHFEGIWHFNFDRYSNGRKHFGTLRVFNDDTLSSGATWPLHPHKHNEVVSYIPSGKFRHEDENGKSSEILEKGGVQHTTIGKGMWHSEINASEEEPLRFVQIWFLPEELGLDPSYEQKNTDRKERTNTILPLVAKDLEDTLPIHSDARVFSSYLTEGKSITHTIVPSSQGQEWGAYIFNVNGDPIIINGKEVPERGAAEIVDIEEINIQSKGETEILILDVRLDAPYIDKFIR